MDASLRQGFSPTDALFADATQSQLSPTTSGPIAPVNGLFEASSLQNGVGADLTYFTRSPESPTAPKPTKRKRLAKACDSCHRSKRRCDGTARCANCEFAGKACTYTSASGQPVPPPRASADKRRDSQIDLWPYSIRTSSISDLDATRLRPMTPTPTTTDEPSLPLDPMFIRELVNLFFAKCHPQTLFIHRPTFLHDISRSQVPRYLLLAVLAVSAPYSARPAFRTTPSWHAGEQFALEAKRSIFQGEATSLNSPGSLESLHVKACLELAQALCLLHASDFVTRPSGESDRLLALAQGVLRVLDVHNMDTLSQVPAHRNYIRNESMRRTFWYIFHIEMLASAFTGKPVPVLPEQASMLRLPSGEASFDMPRIDVRPNVEPPYDYLSPSLEHKVCHSEFANLVRVTTIYSEVVAAIGQRARVLRAWEQGRVPTSQVTSVNKHETELRKWLELLPDHLRLTEDNLQVYLSQLDGGAGSSAWCFLYMHALAESTVLALHEFADLGSDITSVGPPVARQQRALGNLIMILTSMGSSGRTKPMMAILLVTLAKYTTSSQHPQVATWFSEYFQTWGVSYEEMMSLQFRSSWFHGRSEPTAGGLFDDLSQQPLHTVAARGSSVSTQSLSASEQSSGPMISPVTFGDSAMGLTGMTPHGSLFNDGTTAFLFKQLTDGSARGADHSAHVTEDPSASSMSIPRMEEDRAHSETYRGVALDSGEFFPNVGLSAALAPSAGADLATDRILRNHIPLPSTNGLGGQGRLFSTSSRGFSSLGSTGSEEGDSQPASASPQVFSTLPVDHRHRQAFDAISFESIPQWNSANSSPIVTLSSGHGHRISPSQLMASFARHIDDDDFPRGSDLPW